MALTGAFLMLFVLAHLLGNLQIFLGSEWLNAYAEHLDDLPFLLWPMRALLLTALLTHMLTGLWLAVENRRARPVRYAVGATVQASLPSRLMVFLGLSLFCFIVYHLLHFTFGTIDPRIFSLTDAKGRHDVYSMVILGFQDNAATAVYTLAMFFLGAHLRHGAWSFLQTIGWLTESSLPKARRLALVFALLVFIGYASIPVASRAGWLRPSQGGFALGA